MEGYLEHYGPKYGKEFWKEHVSWERDLTKEEHSYFRNQTKAIKAGTLRFENRDWWKQDYGKKFGFGGIPAPRVEPHIRINSSGMEKLSDPMDIGGVDDDEDEPVMALAPPKRKRADSEDQPVSALAPKKKKATKQPNKAPMRPTAMNLALPKLR
jgi:hypothetical protein